MTGRFGRVAGYLAGALLALAVALVAVVRVEELSGGADIALAGVSLAVSVWSMYLAARALRWQETGTVELASRLADAVRESEQRARQQLLGGHGTSIDVTFDLRTSVGPDPAADLRGHLGDVIGYFTRLRPRRLVVTGAPGSGKTVLAIELILGLIEARGPDDPVPVRLSAASWDPHTAAGAVARVEDWLAAHLTRTFQLPASSARALVAAQKVLPVIDGLDELDAEPSPGYASRAGRAVAALNDYQQRRTATGILLTCRTAQYRALQAARVWVHDSARVEINHVGASAARAFITARAIDVGRWRAVLDMIERHRDAPLARALSTPWRLTVALVVYEQRDPDTGAFVRHPSELTAAALGTVDAVRDHLLSLFIPAVAAVHRHPAYSAERVHRWLAVLARYLNRNAAMPRQIRGRTLSGTDLVLHDLWPLAGSRLPRAVTALAGGWYVLLTLLTIVSWLIVGGWLSEPVTTADVVDLATFLLWPVAPVAVLSGYAWAVAWPRPTRLDFRRLRTSVGRRRATVAAVAWLGTQTTLVLGLNLVGWQTGRIIFYDTNDQPVRRLPDILGWLVEDNVLPFLITWLPIAILVGAVAGARFQILAGARDPRAAIRGDIVFGSVVGGLVIAFTTNTELLFYLFNDTTLDMGPYGGVAAGAAAAVATGLAGFRYIVMLLLTRHLWRRRWLPWRLGRFLAWCYEAGLVRVAGIGYQFRHRELQDHLAHHPLP